MNPAKRSALCLLAIALLAPAFAAAHAETCTTQSDLAPAERDHIANAARGLATSVQSNDAAALRARSVAELAKGFGGLQYLVGVTAPKLAGGVPAVEQVYLLDATNLKRNADGSAPDAQFFCSLNHSTMEAEFDIPALPPGKYAFAMVTIAPPQGATVPAPWRLSFLMREESVPQPPAGQSQPGQSQPTWLLAGLYPKPMTAAGHDGLWYWTQARQMARDKQAWNAWLFFQEARKLLQPADFVLSTHLDKLRSEVTDAAPPALSEGISADAPLVVKGADGTEYHFIGLGVDDSDSPSSLDLAVQLRVEPLADPAAARQRNAAAARALLAAYPELRKPFHGVQVSAEAVGQVPFSTEQPMADIQ
jgi:hypothetical protein